MSVSSAEVFYPLSADQAALEIPCGGYGTFGVQLSGTWVGTISFEGTVDHGTWQTVNVTKTNSTSQVTTATGNGVWTGPCAGLLAVRVRFSAYTSGTAQARILIAGTGGGSGGAGGGGGGGGTSSDFGAAFPAAGTAAGFLGSTGNMEPIELEADGSIPVTVVSGGGSNASVGLTGAAVPASATAIGISDESSDLQILAAVTRDFNTTTPPIVPVSMLGIALPGAGGPTAFTGAVTVATLPLPTGAATAARQDTGNTSLASIDGKTPALGQAAMAASVPVVIASNQSTVPVSAATLPLPTGAATLAEQQTQTTALGTILTSANFAAAFGTAGTADAQVMSVQGIASMTPVQVSQATASNLNAQVVGSVANDSADSGNPVKIGYKAVEYAATPTAVTAADRVDALADRAGVPFHIGGHPDVITLEAEYTTAQTDTAVVTVSAGTRIVVTQAMFVVSSATTVAVAARMGLATTNTPTTTGVVLTHPSMVPGAGVSRGDGSGILGIGADGEDLRITCGAATTGAIRVLVTYYTIAV